MQKPSHISLLLIGILRIDCEWKCDRNERNVSNCIYQEDEERWEEIKRQNQHTRLVLEGLRMGLSESEARERAGIKMLLGAIDGQD